MSRNRAIKKWQLERQLRYAVENTNAHLSENPEADPELALRANLSRALQKNAFLQRIESDPWYTDRYNELEGFTGYGTDKSKKLNTELNKNDNWWNKSIDLSLKNPFPEAIWDWFKDSINGNQVWGTGGGIMELGNRRGKNSNIDKSYDMSEWLVPGGGSMKFSMNKKNTAKHLVELLDQYTTAADYGNKLRDEYDKWFPEISSNTTPNEVVATVIAKDTMINLRLTNNYPQFRMWNDKVIDLTTKVNYDSITNIRDTSKILQKMKKKNRMKLLRKLNEFKKDNGLQ